jgi:hypothetical protein
MTKKSVLPVDQNPLNQREGDAAEEATGADDAGCQHSVDTKAFKAFKAFTGRGRAGAPVAEQGIDQQVAQAVASKVAECETRLRRIFDDMKTLARMSKEVGGYSFYLALHHRRSSGQFSLRWRSRESHRHLPWDDMQHLFATQLPVLRDWYKDVQERVATLNRDEQVARGDLHWAKKRAELAATKRAEMLAILSELKDD